MGMLLSQLSNISIILSLSLILLAGFLVTRITKLFKLPNVTGFIIAGILIGPHTLKLIPVEIVANMGFVSDIALAFIAFSVGRFFKKEVFQKTGLNVLIITLFESLLAGLVVFLSMYYIFRLSWDFSLILAAIATATAPASTMVTIRQYKAKGDFVNVLLQVVAFDDAVCLIIFSISAAIINANAKGGFTASKILMPVIYNIVALGVGFLCGIILSKLMTPNRSKDNRLILTVSLLLGIAGLCAAVDISPLLSCMIFGTTYINMTEDKALYKQIESFAPPILSIFFVVSGMSLDLSLFSTMGIIGASYFLIRIIGKYAGAYLGCASTKSPGPMRNFLGLALIPQAGVAIGLAFLGQRILPSDMGNMLLAIILSSSVLYELVGPVSAKIALFCSGAIKKDETILKECPPSKEEITNIENTMVIDAGHIPSKN